uniref:Uncharacterized protein n=1 Tax=Octopus bimaculoides TaxID=37653 RepID=A0A0L8FG35_OCTBM
MQIVPYSCFKNRCIVGAVPCKLSATSTLVMGLTFQLFQEHTSIYCNHYENS